MLIKQLSVFLENRRGKFAGIARLLGDNDINLKCFTVSESADFGLARILVDGSDVETAFNLLKSNYYAVSMNNVICIECPNIPGAMASVMDKLSDAGVFIEYMYAYAEPSKGISHLIIRTDNEELAAETVSDI